MAEVTFTDHQGTSRTVRGEVGYSLMEIARTNDIPGIDADCGGVCACATCHVVVDDAFLDKLPPKTDCEEPMLDFVEDRRKHSRLACQIPFSEDLDGLKVITPELQK